VVSQEIDRFGDEVGADGVGAAEFEEPVLDFRVKFDLPHRPSIS
jgi:hypothetical protein